MSDGLGKEDEPKRITAIQPMAMNFLSYIIMYRDVSTHTQMTHIPLVPSFTAAQAITHVGSAEGYDCRIVEKS